MPVKVGHNGQFVAMDRKGFCLYTSVLLVNKYTRKLLWDGPFKKTDFSDLTREFSHIVHWRVKQELWEQHICHLWIKSSKDRVPERQQYQGQRYENSVKITETWSENRVVTTEFREKLREENNSTIMTRARFLGKFRGTSDDFDN